MASDIAGEPVFFFCGDYTTFLLDMQEGNGELLIPEPGERGWLRDWLRPRCNYRRFICQDVVPAKAKKR